MILLAKQDSKTFLTIAVVVRSVNLVVYIGLYYLWGLRGLGFAYLFNVIQQLLIYTYIMKKKYKIMIDSTIVRLLLLLVFYTIVAILVKLIPNIVVMYIIQSALIATASIFTFRELRKMNIDIVQFVKSKIFKK